MPTLQPIDDREGRAMEFMRRYSEMIVGVSVGRYSVADAEAIIADIEDDTGMDKAEAVATLSERLRSH